MKHLPVAALLALALCLTACAQKTPAGEVSTVQPPASQAPSPQASAPAAATPRPADEEVFVVAAREYLSLRDEPSTKGQRIRKLAPGTLVQELEALGEFSRVLVLETGELGYVMQVYLLKAELYGQTPGANTVVTLEGDVAYVAAEEYLSLRTKADTRSERIRKLSRGSRVLRLNEMDTFSFVQDENTGETGYVLSEYLVSEEEFLSLAAPIKPQNTYYVHANISLTLRKAPSSSAEALAKLLRGTRVTVLEKEGEFSLVETSTGERGYVMDSYLAKSKPETGGSPFVVLANEYVNLRETASSGAASKRKIPAGEQVTVLGYEKEFAYVLYQEEKGYILASHLQPVAGSGSGSGIVAAVENYSYAQMEADLEALAKRYPAQLRLERAGESLEGRTIYAAVLGNAQAKHHVLVQGAIHAREHMTTLLCMKQIEEMLANPGARFGERSNAELLNEVCFHILPMTNPDGVSISQAGEGSTQQQAIYKRDISEKRTQAGEKQYFQQWKANAAGVDLNRNFDVGWELLGGPTEPSASHYKGAKPADQPETKALATYTMGHDFDATISYHAYGSVIYWQYGTDKKMLEESRDLGRAVRAVTGYPLEGADGLDSGGYKDWAMEMRSIPSLTIEVGTVSAPLPLSEFSGIWQRNKQVLQAVAQWVLQG